MYNTDMLFPKQYRTVSWLLLTIFFKDIRMCKGGTILWSCHSSSHNIGCMKLCPAIKLLSNSSHVKKYVVNVDTTGKITVGDIRVTTILWLPTYIQTKYPTSSVWVRDSVNWLIHLGL